MIYCADVAQLDRVPGYEPGGRRFESSRPHHLLYYCDVKYQLSVYMIDIIHNNKICAERWPSGRRRSPAKGVWALTPIEGSNPSLSAINIKPLYSGFFVSKIHPNKTLCTLVPNLPPIYH